MVARSKLRVGLWVAFFAAVAGLAFAVGQGAVQPSFRLVGSTSSLPPALQQEIAANDAAGLPGLDRGVTVPAGCDIRTSLDQNKGRPRIEQERTVHRQMQAGQTPAWITASDQQLQSYLQVSVRDYCSQETGGSTSGSGSGSGSGTGTGSLPTDLQAEIAANDAAGLPGLDNGVTVPAGCDIRTSLDTNSGRPRIEQERTVHRQMQAGQTPAWIAASNQQLQSYLQVSVRDYCSTH